MLAAMYIETTENPVTGMTPPSGWSQVQDNYNSTPGQEHHVIIWKKLASSEGASWTWSWTNSHYREMTVVSYSGVLTSGIEDTSGKGTNSGGSTNMNCGNISPASANTKIIAVYADFNGSLSNQTPPAGFTERDDHSANHGGALGVSDKDQAAAGATGSVDATSATSGATTGVLFAMASEAAAGGGTTVTPGVLALTTSSFAPKANLQINAAAPTALAISAFAPQANLRINGASPTALSLSTFAPAPSISANQTVTPGVLTLALSAFAPQANLAINGAAPTALVLTGLAPQANLRVNAASPTALVLSTFAPQLQLTLTPALVALTLATFAPSLNLRVTPNVVALALTAFAPALAFRITPGPASLVIASFAPSVGAPITVTPGTLALVLAPLIPVIIATGVVVDALGYVSVRDESTALATLHDARMGIALVNDELVARAVLRDR